MGAARGRVSSLLTKAVAARRPHACAGKNLGGHPCKHAGTVFLYGKWWCRLHA